MSEPAGLESISVKAAEEIVYKIVQSADDM